MIYVNCKIYTYSHRYLLNSELKILPPIQARIISIPNKLYQNILTPENDQSKLINNISTIDNSIKEVDIELITISNRLQELLL